MTADHAMSKIAWIYIWGVMLTGLVCALLVFPDARVASGQWRAFIVLTALAITAQLYQAEAPNHISYYATPVFFFAGLLTLDLFLYVLLIVIPSLAEWAYFRLLRRDQAGSHLRAWYLQPFNIASDIFAGLTAYGMYAALEQPLPLLGALSPVVAGSLAALTFVSLNHTLLGLALVLARGKSWAETGMLDIETFASDLILLLLGYVVAVLWQLNPWLILPALSPLVLMYRALHVPQLQEQAQTDPKTGLLNTRSFNSRFTEELERARRHQSSLAVLMADLDYLRTINNTYGHLAGDAVLIGVGRIIRTTIRKYEFAARFGGEEFAIVMPEADRGAACVLAERIRSAVEAEGFVVSTNAAPLRATISIGIACFPAEGDDPAQLTHQADVAVYYAKQRGRNRVVYIGDLPQAARVAGIPFT
jgi:diguanylate cyclase (GGDEF)-like protein